MLGKKDENEQWLFPAKGALEPTDIAIAVGERLIRTAPARTSRRASAELKRLKGNKPTTAEAATRIPYFCPGCPHNSSTVVPEGSRAYAGIGCHYMAHWMDRSTEGFTQMGGEGANWIGEAPFSKTRARLPEPRRRHLHPLGQPRHPRGAGGGRQHHLQDPLQRRGRHDRRPVAGRRHRPCR